MDVCPKIGEDPTEPYKSKLATALIVIGKARMNVYLIGRGNHKGREKY